MKNKIKCLLNEIIMVCYYILIACICYDDACHLKKFAINPSRSELTEVSKKMSQLEYYIDRFHFPNHVDKWCKKECNPFKSDILKEASPSFSHYKYIFCVYNKKKLRRTLEELYFRRWSYKKNVFVLTFSKKILGYFRLLAAVVNILNIKKPHYYCFLFIRSTLKLVNNFFPGFPNINQWRSTWIDFIFWW